MERIVAPRATVEELYAAAVSGDAEAPIRRFLEALGLSGFQGSTAGFREELQSALLEKLGLSGVLSSIPGHVSPSPADLTAGGIDFQSYHFKPQGGKQCLSYLSFRIFYCQSAVATAV